MNQNKAVYFNAYWKSCHPASNPLQDQAPKTCGDWRTRVASGATLIQGDGAAGAGTALAGDASAANVMLAMPVSAYNTLWQAWGLKSRPANYDQLVAQRYGFALADRPNPYPLPGEDLNRTNGGSGQLPMAFTQLRNADGSWSGKLGFSSCNACHASRIDAPAGTPQVGAVYGAGGLSDLAILLRDLGKGALALLPIELNRTRGTGNITNFQGFELLTMENPQQLAQLPAFILNNFAASTGTEDSPVWWNVGHRTLKFFDGGQPTDATRIELSASFPLAVDPEALNLGNAESWILAHEMDSDAWLMSLKAPSYPYGFCSNADGSPGSGDNPACINQPLAQQGAILFHSKNLWDAALDNPVPKPDGGNGSCASCHGAYSPQYANDPAYLDSPAMAGIAGYVVPQNVIATDPQRLVGNSQIVSKAMNASWFIYSDQPQLQCGDQNLDATRGARALGYLAPPLYGVWATAPYFHNGSVPSVWDVLKPSDRPTIWRRVSAPAIPG
ncbi:MAG: hypothetical protein P4L83_00045, partial [Nevskia sp.]|nr:hypothetical protein [Nevskia sp.]